jgi:phosphatidylserine/phosphatidylglycerophosphate/cardiolipin synthase-like enzyme
VGRSEELGLRVKNALRSLVKDLDLVGGKRGDEPGVIDNAVGQVVDYLEQRTAGSSLLRFHPRTSRDRICAVDRPAELSVQVDPILAFSGNTVRFFVDGKPVGDSRLDLERTSACLFTPKNTGLFPVTFEVVGDDKKLRPVKTGGTLLQVVGDSPVAVVDAGLLFIRGPQEFQPIRDLAESGWAICYTDLDKKDRTSEIRKQLTRCDLPEGAILIHPEEDAGFPTLGVDFRKVFAATTWRRMRAIGVPMTLVVAEESHHWKLADTKGTASVDLPGLRDLLKEEKALQELEHAAGEFSTRFRGSNDLIDWRLNRMTGTRALPGNECAVEFDNHRARREIFKAIDHAASSILIQFYILTDDTFGDALAVHLIRAARRGVRVRLMADALFSTQEVLGIKNRMIQGLGAEPNVEVVAVDPIKITDEFEAVRLKQRDHRKVFVIDDQIAYVSGRNAGNEYYTGFDEVHVTDWTASNRVPWLDAHIRIDGPLVGPIIEMFRDSWERNGGKPFVPDAVASKPVGSSRARLVVHHGVTDSNTLGAYEAIIDAAESHLFLMNDFPVVRGLAAALKRAVLRGVEISFLTGNAAVRRDDGTFLRAGLHRELFEYMTKARFESLMEIGVRVFEYSPGPLSNVTVTGGLLRPYVHAKVMSADGKVLSVGSANLDATASYWEREAIVVVQDPVFVAEVEVAIQAMIDGSKLIDPDSDYWKKETTQRTLVSRLWPDSVYS